jgi:hypothetical protein
MAAATAACWVSNCSPSGVPDLVRTSGTRVEPGHEHLVAYVPVPYGQLLIANLVPGGKLALLLADVHSNLSFQFKGRLVSHRPSNGEELAFQRRYVEDFCREIEKQGMVGWELLFPVYFRQPSLALVMRVEEVYEQTPKAGTGERIYF